MLTAGAALGPSAPPVHRDPLCCRSPFAFFLGGYLVRSAVLANGYSRGPAPTGLGEGRDGLRSHECVDR